MPALTLEQLKQHPTFTRLSDRLQVMVEAYLSNGRRKIKAVKAAYPNCKETSARVMSSTHFRRDDVVECLNTADGFSERAIFEEQLRQAMRSPKTTPSQFAALRMFAEMKGWVVKGTQQQAGKRNSTAAPAVSEPHRWKVGDVCDVTGKQYKITSVDANGKPTAGDPL